jgi:hypothetical protein
LENLEKQNEIKHQNFMMKMEEEYNRKKNQYIQEIQRMANNNQQIDFEKFHRKMNAIENEIKEKKIRTNNEINRIKEESKKILQIMKEKSEKELNDLNMQNKKELEQIREYYQKKIDDNNNPIQLLLRNYYNNINQINYYNY